MERAAVLCLYSYLWAQQLPREGERFADIVERLTDQRGRDRILQHAARRDKYLADSRIEAMTHSEAGLSAFAFRAPDGEVTAVFRGTGRGEWTDNGLGLAGIPAENVYRCGGRQVTRTDYATAQQVEALNWFCGQAERYGWHDVTVTGHSKGGNKAQFTALHSDLVWWCYSFDGQGFSPEALAAFALEQGEDFSRRQSRIYSLSADNDYVNVLGERAAPQKQILYFEAPIGRDNAHAYHFMEAILDEEGRLRPLSGQGHISRYIQGVSRRLMALPSAVRRYATVGLMDLFQQYMGEPAPCGERLSKKERAVGLGLSIGPLLAELLAGEEGSAALREIVHSYGDDLITGIAQITGNGAQKISI